MIETYSVCFNPLQLFLLVLRLSQLWLMGISLSWLLNPFDMILIVVDSFLAIEILCILPPPDPQNVFEKLKGHLTSIKKNIYAFQRKEEDKSKQSKGKDKQIEKS